MSDLEPSHVRVLTYAGSLMIVAAAFTLGLWVVGAALLVSYAQEWDDAHHGG